MIDNFKVIVSGFVFNTSGDLLVVRRSADEETFPGMLAIPGGTVEVTPNSGLTQNTIENNLIREVKEETNIDIAVDGWMESSAIAKEKAKLYLFFKCSTSGNEIPSASNETPEVFWLDPSKINVQEATPALAEYVKSVYKKI
jgi:8-oxo-dGTP pyrophosphatase MutT (NUDIX family)